MYFCEGVKKWRVVYEWKDKAYDAVEFMIYVCREVGLLKS